MGPRTGQPEITERSAFGIVTDLAEAGYVIEEQNGLPQPLPPPGALRYLNFARRERAIGEILTLLTGSNTTGT